MPSLWEVTAVDAGASTVDIKIVQSDSSLLASSCSP